jgi:hypothetical protein
VVETLQYWPHNAVSLIPQLFHYEKGQPRTGSGEMVRVAMPTLRNIRGDIRWWSRYFSSGAGPVLVLEYPSEG